MSAPRLGSPTVGTFAEHLPERKRQISGAGAAPRIQPKGDFLASKSKKNQINPNKNPWIPLDLLGFIRPNRDFSMGYSGKNKKNLASISGCTPNASRSARSP
jgi:hypothetical protein